MSDLASIVSGVANGYGSAGPLNRLAPIPPPGPNGLAATTPSSSVAPAGLDVNNRLESVFSATDSADRVEVSSFARYLDQLRRLPEVRLDRVHAARAAIAQGVYDSEDVLNTTIDRLTEQEL